MSSEAVCILWLRKDLRIHDNPALSAAIATGLPVVPLYIWDVEGEGNWPLGAASKWWLSESLQRLEATFSELGSRLVLRSGRSLDALQALRSELDVKAVYWNRRYEPSIIERDKKIKRTLLDEGIDARSFNGSLLASPLRISNKAGDPYKVFTPFWKRLQLESIEEPLEAPKQLLPPATWPSSKPLEEFSLKPSIPWDAEFYDYWSPGEVAALRKADAFAKENSSLYPKMRDIPSEEGVSRLSPHLHFGEISPRRLWSDLSAQDNSGAEAVKRQLAWREFAYHLLYHFPETPEEPLDKRFKAFPWEIDEASLKLWQEGRTGYPIIDAGMRQLWRTGWMHNRVRMIVGSLLVKQLLQPWSSGADWFWDTLVDADLANNTLGWQWVGGCGADAAPYFRVFNPILQTRKFDPEGAYIKRWVPELERLPSKWIAAPWEAPAEVLRFAGVELGENYPLPIVALDEGREKALAAYQRYRSYED